MPTTLHITEVEGTDEHDVLVFRVRAFDSGAAEVTLGDSNVFNNESWAGLAADVAWALKLLELEQ